MRRSETSASAAERADLAPEVEFVVESGAGAELRDGFGLEALDLVVVGGLLTALGGGVAVG